MKHLFGAAFVVGALLFAGSGHPIASIMKTPEAAAAPAAEDQAAGSVVRNREAGEVKLHETVAMGAYPQSGSEPRPIEWIVLGEENGRVLLLSRYGIDARPFNDERKTVSWNESSLRKWLNGDFYASAFSDADRQGITGSGDKIFLLSREEVEKYLPKTEERLCAPTACAVRHGAYASGEGYSAWWLRSPREGEALAGYLNSSGDFGSRAHHVDETVIAVRPALWVNKTALK